VPDDVRQSRFEPSALVRPGVEYDAADPQIVSRLEISGKRALGSPAHRWIVARQVYQIDRVKVERRISVLGSSFLERRDASFIELGRAPESGRRGVNLDRLGTHGGSSLEGEVEAAGRIDVGTKKGHT